MSKRNFLVSVSIYALLFALPVAVYLSVSGHQFLTVWGDHWMVLNRYTIGGLNVDNLGNMFSELYRSQYTPVNQLSYTALYSIFGANPKAFHLANLLYHAINVCLVYAFVKMIFELRKQDNNKSTSIVAFITAILFAVHPVNTEVVTWISASKVSLYTLFGLSALLCYLHYRKSHHKGYYALSITFFIFSMGCNEHAFALPLATLLIDWFIGCKVLGRKLLAEKIPFLLLTLAGLLFMLLLRSGDSVSNHGIYPPVQYLVFNCYALTDYLTKLVMPVNLMHIYPFPIMPGFALPARLWIYPVIIVSLAGVVACFRKYDVLLFGALFFLVNVLLTMYPFSISKITIADDRFVYLASIGFFMTIVWYGTQYFKNIKRIGKVTLSRH